ncbi:MAG: hypothetical protein ACXADU_01635 [Promethearchaeota archaeon]
MILLESTIIYSVKRQNRYILFYGLLLFIGMLVLILLDTLNGHDPPIFSLKIYSSGYPGWAPTFFIYVFLSVTCFAIIPLFYTSFKIYNRFENKDLKRRWYCYLIGFLGLAIFVLYPILLLNLLPPIMEGTRLLAVLRLVVSIISLTVFLWGYLIYYGIGFKLKQEEIS